MSDTKYITATDLQAALSTQTAELKQFLLGALAANNQHIDKRFDQIDNRIDKLEMKMDEGFDKVDKRVDKLEKKMDEGFAGIGDIITGINDRHDTLARRVKHRGHKF